LPRPRFAVCTHILIQAAAYLGEYLEAQYGGLASLSMAPLSRALRAYTQESARHAIESKTVQYLAELRRVTTVFINIKGLESHLLGGGLFYVQQVGEKVKETAAAERKKATTMHDESALTSTVTTKAATWAHLV
jgi:hypothetical protein